MDLAQTFGRMAFYQILLGIVTFCFAEANPGMLLVAGSLVVLSMYVTEGPWGKPLPWWAINLMAVGAVSWLAFELLTFQNIIISMGHFTIWLQVLLLYARKSNREYGQLLMLSLLQMIGASVLSVSIIYGALLGVYCVLALLTVLVFQLKSSSDRVFEANRQAASDRRRVTRPKPVVGRGYRWHFRATATVIATICALAAAVVFVVAPRSSDAPLAGDSGGGLGPRQVGFSQQVRLDGEPIAQGSEEPVMNLRVQLHGEPVENRSWLMRGAALDTYDPETHTWKRSAQVASTDRRIRVDHLGMDLAPLPLKAPVWRARVTLRQIGHRNLFTLLPVTRFQSDSISSVVFSREDLQLSAGGAVMGAVIYDISWPYINVPGLQQRYRDLGQPSYPGDLFMQPQAEVVYDKERYARGWPTQRKRFADYTQRVLSPLGLQRNPDDDYSPNDARIAKALADHLRQTCTYQMGGPRLNKDREPIVEFLFGHRTGHCELFASSLAAMTRSIGMQARVVTGFRASEFNQIGGYYVVRQNDAHAWVEVNLGPDQGWRAYDATPAQEMDRQARNNRVWLLTTLREAYEYIEFGWIRSIVAYDIGTRHALLSDLGDKIKTAASDQNAWLGQAVEFVRLLPTAWRLDKANTSKAVGSALLAAIISAALLRVVVVRRRRLAKLKLTALPPTRQRDLARQLAFYIDMNALLARHGHVRPRWQNPRDYARSLAGAQPGKMDPVVALTDIFYRVRFGDMPLDPPRRQRVRVYLRQLERSLAGDHTAQTGRG
jgi:protein-glutamine gamma-glutamyltransferase